MINMLGIVPQPVRLVTLGCIEEPIYFDEASSYWPKSLKDTDLFDTAFKMVTNVGAISQNRDIGLCVLYKGTHFLISDWAENTPPNQVLVWTWKAETPPTIKEFVEALGGSITESMTVEFTWEVVYREGEGVCIMDTMPARIYVEVPGTNWLMIAVGGGIIIGVGAIAYSVLKKPAVVRA